ncbi:helix-turn-helix domain-containing protein [Leuconostoc citreum]|uniref:helix-turn-helix domain-containing protein n=1 Tax=Leuconostoc citreum TaxID=33964 RepID=UPI0021A38644|nr:helix-turn-helix transcriptional regulator [Leuconostoc citreum]MCT3077393.1 XRE family transcriptional regulator [Leuconostoc citreum]
MTILDRTKEIAKLRGISLTDTAIKAGLAEKSIYSWDRSTPKADNLQKVADVLHVSTDYLLGRTDELNLTTSETVKKADIDDSDLLLAFDGKDIDEEDKQAIIDLLMFRRYQKRNEGK